MIDSILGMFGKKRRKDINLPDEKKGKPVRAIGGGMTRGGEPNDARWIEHNKRKSDQVIGRLSGWGRAVRGDKK